MAASMLWSRIAKNNGPGFGGGLHYQVPNVGSQNVTNDYIKASPEDVGLRYRRDVAVSSSRLALRKGGVLYFVCATQPAILLALLVLGRLLYSTPIDRRFGLVSLLAGIDGTGPDILRGAAFSNTLQSRIRLGVEVDELGHERARVRYTLGTMASQRGDAVRPGWKYG